MTSKYFSMNQDIRASADGLASIPNSGEWNQSLPVGKIGEEAGRRLIEAAGYTVFEAAQGYQPDYDFVYTTPEGQTLKLEMKTDQTTYSNVFVECDELDRGGNRRPSGLYKTKSDFYAVYHTQLKRMFIAPAESLRQYIARTKPETRVNTSSNTKPTGYLIPQSRWSEVEGAQVFNFA